MCVHTHIFIGTLLSLGGQGDAPFFRGCLGMSTKTNQKLPVDSNHDKDGSRPISDTAYIFHGFPTFPRGLDLCEYIQ